MAEPRPENPRDRIVPGAWDGTYAVEAERVPEVAGAVDAAPWIEARRQAAIRAFDGVRARMRAGDAVAWDGYGPDPEPPGWREFALGFACGREAEHARAERLAASWAEVEEIGRSLDLVGFDLNDGLVCQHAERLREIARAALAGDAPGRGEG